MDEASSALDSNSERRVMKSVLSVSSDTAILFATHRNNNLDLFDRTVLVENGVVQEVEHVNQNVSNLSPKNDKFQ